VAVRLWRTRRENWPACARPVVYLIASMERPMIADIASHREELRELCRRFHVRRLDLFGSATGDDFDPARSDLDFLVEFEPEALSFDVYFRPQGGA